LADVTEAPSKKLLTIVSVCCNLTLNKFNVININVKKKIKAVIASNDKFG